MPALRALQLLTIGLVILSSVALAGGSWTGPAAADSSVDGAEGPDGNVTILRGSHDLLQSLDSPTAVRTAREAGRLREPQYLLPGELLVLQFESPRISTALANTTGSTPTERFFRLTNSTNSSLAINERRPGVEQEVTTLRLNRSNVVIRHDSATATVSVLVDTRTTALVTRKDGAPVRRNLSSLEFQAVVTTPTENGIQRVLAGASRFLDPAVSVQSPTQGVYFTDTVPATIQPNTSAMVITGTTSLLPGTNVTVALKSQGRTHAATTVVTRDANRSDRGYGPTAYSARLGLDSLALDDRLTLVVRRQNTTLTTQPIVVGKPPRIQNTTARFVTSGPHAGQINVTTSVRVPARGFLRVYVDDHPVQTAVPDDRWVQRTVYVDPAAVDRDTGRLDVYTLWDQDGDGEFNDIKDQVFRTPLDIGAATPNAQLDASVPVTNWEQAVTTPTRSTTPTRASPTTSPGVAAPGFGPLAVIISGSVALGLLLVRTRAGR